MSIGYGNIFQKGPSEELNHNYKAKILARLHLSNNQIKEALLITPEPYYMTALMGIKCVENILNSNIKGESSHGVITPSQAFGAEFILGFDGVEYHNL